MSKAKIFTQAELAKHLKVYRNIYHPIVLVTGCFDIIHVGHVDLMEKAAEIGMVLVGVNSDAAVQKLKGPTRPINNQADRCTVLCALQSVDRVFVIDDTKVTQAILDMVPHVWVKGGDYNLDTLDKEEVAAARKVEAEIVIVPSVHGHSTTQIVMQLAK